MLQNKKNKQDKKNCKNPKDLKLRRNFSILADKIRRTVKYQALHAHPIINGYVHGWRYTYVNKSKCIVSPL